MKDGASSPDGRKLADLKAIPLVELASHFNLWLLAGYQPATLCRGETVMLRKEPGTCLPEKHHPITVLHGDSMLPLDSSVANGDISPTEFSPEGLQGWRQYC